MKKISFLHYPVSKLLILSALLISTPAAATICDDIVGLSIHVDKFSPDKTGSLNASLQVQEAFDCFSNKISSGASSAEIIFSPGTYRLDQRIELLGDSLANNAIENLVVSGVGTQAINFIVNNNDGGINISLPNNRRGMIEFKNLKFTANVTDAGTAINVVHGVALNQHRRTFLARDIEIAPTSDSLNYFEYGIKLQNTWRPLIQNIVMTGPFGPNVDDPYQTKACFDLTDTYSPTVVDSRCWSADIGFNLVGTGVAAGHHPEGISISSSKFVTTNIGINITTAGSEPEGFISKNHINSRKRGIVFNNRSKAIIEGNLMYNDFADHSFYQDILVFNSQDIIITNNTFFNAKTVDHPNRTAVRIANQSQNTVISNNLFRNEGAGVTIASGVTGTRVINNHFIGTSPNVAGSGTGTIDTPNY